MTFARELLLTRHALTVFSAGCFVSSQDPVFDFCHHSFDEGNHWFYCRLRKATGKWYKEWLAWDACCADEDVREILLAYLNKKGRQQLGEEFASFCAGKLGLDPKTAFNKE